MIKQLNLGFFGHIQHNTKHMMQGTSLYAYRDILEGLGTRQAMVMDCLIHRGPLSNRQMQLYLNLPINCITGRTRELVKAGLIEKKGTRINENNRPEIQWGVLR